MIDWSGYIGLILQGALVTIELTVMGSVLALVMAFAAGLGRLSRFFAVRTLATSISSSSAAPRSSCNCSGSISCCPFGVTLTPLQAGVLALGLNVGAYGAEVVRGAVRAIGREQHEACVALNLGRYHRMRHVILPQALPLMLPTFGNNAIELLKGTAVVSLISLTDMTFQAQVVRAQTGSTLIPFATILVLYFAMACAISAGVRSLERRMVARPRRCEGLTMEWDWAFVWEIMPTLLEGLKITILATIAGRDGGGGRGLVLAIAALAKSADFALGRLHGRFHPRHAASGAALFHLLRAAGYRYPPVAAGRRRDRTRACTTAPMRRKFIAPASTTCRADSGRRRKATNLSIRQAWIHVMLPQAIPPMIPALANYFIAMFKETPLLSAITVLELMNQAKSVANSSYRYIEPITMVGVFFLVISLISVVALRWLEERYARVDER
jgi:polar amino acid transport system permease protein